MLRTKPVCVHKNTKKRCPGWSFTISAFSFAETPQLDLAWWTVDFHTYALSIWLPGDHLPLRRSVLPVLVSEICWALIMSNHFIILNLLVVTPQNLLVFLRMQKIVAGGLGNFFKYDLIDGGVVCTHGFPKKEEGHCIDMTMSKCKNC